MIKTCPPPSFPVLPDPKKYPRNSSPKTLIRVAVKDEVWLLCVLTETVKQQENAGKKPQLFFYRDKQKNEVDIIWKKAQKLTEIEIKSSETFHKAFLKPVQKFRDIDHNHETQGIIIYSGQFEQVIDDIEVINYQHIGNID